MSGYTKSSANRLIKKLKQKKTMTKIAIVVFSDTDTVEALGKVSNAFMLANEAVDHGDDLKFIFEGAGTKWIGELEKKILWMRHEKCT